MITMRAKLKVDSVEKFENAETINFSAVYKNEYDETGLDENNTYAKFTPSASLNITIMNPTLIGKFIEEQEYYVDFMKVE